MQKIQNNNNFYVYFHINKSNGKVFYIGKGTNNRAYSDYKRNKHWCNVVNKHGYEVAIVTDNLTSQEAFNLEMRFISFYGIENLTNMTIGGDGCLGMKDESKVKLSNSLKEYFKNNKVYNRIDLSNTDKKNIVKLYNSGLSSSLIVKETNHSLWMVNKTLKECNVKKRIFKSVSKEIFYDLYINKDFNINQMTNFLNCSRSNVNRIASLYNIKKREIKKEIKFTNESNQDK